MHETHTAHDDTPSDLECQIVHVKYRLSTPYHNDGQEDTGLHLLKQDIGQRLEDGVTDKEDGQCGIVLAVGHLQILLKTIDFRIAYVRSIEEGWRQSVRCRIMHL